MTFLPIAEREPRIRARRPGTFALRCVAATIALGLCGVLLMFSALSPSRVGATAFKFLMTLGFLYCLYEGLRNTADCLSEEKRAGTLGFLFLTDLKGYDVVIGKLLATSLSSFYALLAILPAIGIPLLSGGVTAGEFWRGVLVLIVTLFFSLATGLLVSSASRSERRAWSVSLAILFFAAVVPPVLRWIPFVPFHLLSWASPTVAFLEIAESRYNSQPGTFWASVIGVHTLSWAFLAGASVILPRSWQQRDVDRVRRVLVPMNAAKRQLLLEQNPMVWLASRDEKIKVYLWGLVAVFAAGFLSIWTASGFAGPVLGGFAICLFVFHFLIAARVAFHVCHTFVDARDSGLLQLLLSTPLKSNDILDGFRAAFKRLFAGPVILLLWIEGAIVASFFLLSNQKDDLILGAFMLIGVGAMATAFVMDLHAVATFGMWVSLRAKKPSQAFNKTVLMALVMPALIGAFCCSVAYPITAILKNLIFFSYRTPLYRDFRKMIAEQEGSAAPSPK
ncbi:MAG TPA: ABC transporter permease subunit [Verrucomicrobiae bacterium]|nr:ABC transporter permease subunit [Verrucomicrobiae bacterium]